MDRRARTTMMAVAAASLVATAPVVAWSAPRASAAPATPAKPTPIAGACPVTPTGAYSGPAHAAARAEPAVANGSGAPYYGNPKVGVEVASDAPGLCPSFPDSTPMYTDILPDLSGFVISSALTTPAVSRRPATESAAVTCVTGPADVATVVQDLDGTCQMDPDGDGTFPMPDDPSNYDFTLTSVPLGWAADPDFPAPQVVSGQISPCTPGTRGSNGCVSGGNESMTDPTFVSSDSTNTFNYIGIFRHVTVAVTSATTKKPMPGVTVELACTVPHGQPSDVCPAAEATARSDASGVATFAGLYAPGAPLTLSETDLPPGYRSVTESTTVASPVTARTTTGLEISNATAVPAALAVAPTAAAGVVAIAATAGGGYLVATAGGNVYNYRTGWYGSPHADHVKLRSPVVGITATAGGGYLVATAGGNIYNYRTGWYGSPHADHVKLATPVAGITAGPDGVYREATRDGNVFAWSARGHGTSRANRHKLRSPVVGITATAGGGYLEATAGGNVYNSATGWYGSPYANHLKLTSPVVGITATAGGGYQEATAGGVVYSWAATWHGSPLASHARLVSPMVGIAEESDGGYLVASAAGNVYNWATGWYGSPFAGHRHFAL